MLPAVHAVLQQTQRGLDVVGDGVSDRRWRDATTTPDEQGVVKISQKVVHGDEITRTEIKDSVVSKSSIGAGGKSKAEQIKEIKELLDAGAISEEDYQKMKREIVG